MTHYSARIIITRHDREPRRIPIEGSPTRPVNYEVASITFQSDDLQDLKNSVLGHVGMIEDWRAKEGDREVEDNPARNFGYMERAGTTEGSNSNE